MKVEKRGENCFISHNDLTIFCNKRPDGYEFRVQVRENGQWHLVGEMSVQKDVYLQIVDLMKQLS